MLPSPAALQPSVPCPGAGSSRQQEPSTSKDREDETSLQGGAGGGGTVSNLSLWWSPPRPNFKGLQWTEAPAYLNNPDLVSGETQK